MIKNRIKELRRGVPASTLLPHPKNWRTHDKAQRSAFRGLLKEVGLANAVVAYETKRGLQLIDGHLRVEELGKQPVDVLVLDVSEAEARKLLATMDPLGAMATTNAEALRKLTKGMGDSVVSDLLKDLLSKDTGAAGRFDPLAEWEGMPEFTHEDKTAYQTVKVHFKDAASVKKFAKLVRQKLTEHTRFIWFPEVKDEREVDKRYADES